VAREHDFVMRCPACGGHDVRRSYSRGILDAFMVGFHKVPFRCRGCTHRFYRNIAPKTEDEPETKVGAREQGPE
jgi:transcriptional regulator NrdR family protein